jgi:hypothetical protein
MWQKEMIIMLKLRLIKGHDYYQTLTKLLNNKDLNILHSKNGKPYLANSKYYFSIAHCDNKTLIVTSLRPLGVDMELIRPYDHKLLKYLHLNDNYSNKAFFKEWTRREAYLKRYDLKLNDINKFDYSHNHLISFKLNKYMISICF